MKKILAVAIFILGASLFANAQTQISKESMTHDGAQVTVSFEVDTDVKNLPSNRKEIITPYIYNGKDTLWFDALEVYGKGRYKRERQVNHINGDKTWELGENQVMKGTVYSYTAQVPLKRWMKSANLGIRRQLVGCACEKDLADENLAEGVELFQEPQVQRRTPSYVLSEVHRNWDFGKDELEIIFKVSKIEIDSTVFNNEMTFGKILSAVDKIQSDPSLKLDKIEVAGYASPEGPTKFNTWLGENRAKALINYIIEHRPEYNLSMDHFRIVNGEENWEGLRRVLEESDMEDKEEVISIIDNENLSGVRKKAAIQALAGGQVWTKMLKEIYPHLRCARYLAVYYDEADDKLVETIIKANTLIDEGKYGEALKEIEIAKEDPRAFNTVGVALMMQGRFEDAMIWFQKAVSENHTVAQKNIDIINAEYEWEAQQKAIIDEYLKKIE